MNPPIQNKFSLSGHNSLGVPAICDYYLEAENISQLRHAVEEAEVNKLSILVLGEGTNIVFASDFNGLVLRPQLKGIEILGETEKGARVRVASGENWHEFVSWTIERGYSGLENLALIPGSCGAAPVQNIGAYGVELSDVLVSVDYFDLESRVIKTLDKEACQFGYRDSIFKRELFDKAVITSLCLDLKKNSEPCLEYPALSEYLKSKNLEPTPSNVFSSVIDIRSSKLPDISEIPNVGSFFKNPTMDKAAYEKLQSKYTSIPGYVLEDDEIKVPAAWLIEHLGWKGKVKGGVGVYDKQSLVLINPGYNSGKKIIKLASQIQKDVLETFSISLEIEPRVIS